MVSLLHSELHHHIISKSTIWNPWCNDLKILVPGNKRIWMTPFCVQAISRALPFVGLLLTSNGTKSPSSSFLNIIIHKAATALASAFQEAADYSSLCLTGVITEPSAGFLDHLLKHSGVGPRTPQIILYSIAHEFRTSTSLLRKASLTQSTVKWYKRVLNETKHLFL